MAPFKPEDFLRDLQPVLGQTKDEVDKLLNSEFTAESEAGYAHPNLTEDHLLRRLNRLYQMRFDHSAHALEAEKLLKHPAAGDRVAAYAAFAPKSHSVFYRSSQSGLSRIKDPAILDAAIEHLNTDKFPSFGFELESDPLLQTLNQLQKNPNLTAKQEKKLLLGRHGDKALYRAKHPEAVNAFARRNMARNDALDAQLLEHPLLDPSILEEALDKYPELQSDKDWISVVAKRHPEAKRLLEESADESRLNGLRIVEATKNSPQLKDDAEWHRFLLNHGNTSYAAVEKGLGIKQDIDELARTSKGSDVLQLLVRKSHPHADDDTVNTILNRTDLGAGQRFGAMKGIVRAALRNHADKAVAGNKVLGDKALLNVLKHAGPEHLDSTHLPQIGQWMPDSVANAIAEAGDGNNLKDWQKAAAIHPGLSRENQLKLLPTYPHALRDNPNAHPDVISELIKPDDEDMDRHLRIRRLIQHPNFDERHIEQLRAQGDFKDFDLHQDALSRTTNPEFIREAFDKIKDLPQGPGEYGPGTKEIKSILSNTRVQIPDDILTHGASHPNYQVAEAALKRMEQRHLDSVIERHPKHVAQKTNDPRHLERLIDHQDEWVRKRVYDNPNTPVELLRSAHERIKAKAEAATDHSVERNYRQAALLNEADGIENRIANLDPDSVFKQRVGVRYNTGKLRQVRDHLEHANVPEMRLKDLPEHLASVIKASKAGINPKNGNVNLQMLQQHIDNLPATQFNVSHASWGGIQRHNDEDSNVFQLNVTTDHVNQMKQAGVYNTFRKLQDDFRRSHPVSDTAFGWVRWTGQPGINPGDGVFVDETQSDHTVPLAEKARATAIKRHKDSGGDPEVAKQLGQKEFDRVNAQYPAEHQKKINQILFGKKHSSEVLLEAFHQHLRDEGWAGTKIAIHSVHSKAPISLNAKRGPDGKVDKTTLPGHFIEGYENVPKSMGMRESTYHKDNMGTQSSPSLQGVATHQDDLRKKEENAIFQWVAMVKAEKGVHGNGIDDDFGPEVEVKLPEHAIWAEYTKRKHD